MVAGLVGAPLERKIWSAMSSGISALVFGATGYTGQALLHELRRRGYAVTAHVRPGSRRKPSLSGHEGVAVIECEWQPEPLLELVRSARPRYVFSVIGTTKARGRQDGISGDVYDRVDRALTERALRAVQQGAPHALFVFLSSLGVKPTTRNAYLRARARAEAALVESGLSYIIARPSFISGPDRDEARPLERIAARFSDAALDLGAAVGAARLRERYRSLTASELARALVNASERTECHNLVLEAGELRQLLR